MKFLMAGYFSKYVSIISPASEREMFSLCASPNAEMPYMIPKFTIFALRRISGVTSLRGTA